MSCTSQNMCPDMHRSRSDTTFFCEQDWCTILVCLKLQRSEWALQMANAAAAAAAAADDDDDDDDAPAVCASLAGTILHAPSMMS